MNNEKEKFKNLKKPILLARYSKCVSCLPNIRFTDKPAIFQYTFLTDTEIVYYLITLNIIIYKL